MFLAAIADLKIIEKRLHIRRQPTLLSWSLLFLSVVFFFDIFRRLTDNFLFAIVSLMGETMFGLDALARWENLTLDKEQNVVIAGKCTWTDKLMARNPENTTIMKLSDVRHVGVSVNMGLFFVRDDGKTVGLDTRGLTRNEIQRQRKLIKHFINNQHWTNVPPPPADFGASKNHSLHQRQSSIRINDNTPPSFVPSIDSD